MGVCKRAVVQVMNECELSCTVTFKVSFASASTIIQVAERYARSLQGYVVDRQPRSGSAGCKAAAEPTESAPLPELEYREAKTTTKEKKTTKKQQQRSFRASGRLKACSIRKVSGAKYTSVRTERRLA